MNQWLSGLERLKTNRIYLVGGALRDWIMGRTFRDMDIVVAGDARAVAETLARRHGTHVIVLGADDRVSYRIVTPFGWVDLCAMGEGDIRMDLSRRDFTMNAMAMDLSTHECMDPLNGRADIDARRVRMVCPQAFQSDPVRILRGFRFAAELGFSIEGPTLSAMEQYGRHLSEVAGERIREELSRLLKCDDSRFWIRNMMETGILSTLLPELGPLAGCTQNRYHDHDVLRHSLNTFATVEQWIGDCPEAFSPYQTHIPARTNETDAFLLKLAALLHDIGKPHTRSVDAKGEVHFYGHEKTGALMAAERLRRLRFPEKQIVQVHTIIRHHLQPLFLFRNRHGTGLQSKSMTRFFMRCGNRVPDILLHSLADAASKGSSDAASATSVSDGPFGRYLGELMVRHALFFEPIRKTPPWITGHDLIQTFGLTPGPHFKKLLMDVREMQLSGEITTKAQALERVAHRCLELGIPLSISPWIAPEK